MPCHSHQSCSHLCEASITLWAQVTNRINFYMCIVHTCNYSGHHLHIVQLANDYMILACNTWCFRFLARNFPKICIYEGSIWAYMKWIIKECCCWKTKKIIFYYKLNIASLESYTYSKDIQCMYVYTSTIVIHGRNTF